MFPLLIRQGIAILLVGGMMAMGGLSKLDSPKEPKTEERGTNMQEDENKRICPECNKKKDSDSFLWVNDRYNIPYKKVCDDCYEKVREEISHFVFDESYAGESLD